MAVNEKGDDAMSSVTEILDRLNSYDGPNETDDSGHVCGPECDVPCDAPAPRTIWTELIYQLPELDPYNTVHHGYGQEFALRDGTSIVYDGQLRQWVVLEKDPREDPGWLHL